MSSLSAIIQAVRDYDRFVEREAARVRKSAPARAALLRRWRAIRNGLPEATTPTGFRVPRLALPLTDEPGEIARFLYGQGLPGEFPFVNGAYREMYLAPAAASLECGGSGATATPLLMQHGVAPQDETSASAKPPPRAGALHKEPTAATIEEPTRLFAGQGLAEDTNRRFHYLTGHQRSARLSTAFDGPTLYGLDSDTPDVFGKIGEGGVAIDTVEDMVRLYAGFPLAAPHVSVSMTINAPAPILLAMYVVAARRRFGPAAVARLRGTVQADILKEVQAQNEVLFPLDASLRFLTDMVEYATRHMPRWYPISISGYHMAEAGATPIQQAAYTLSNGFTYVDLFRRRGLDVNRFGPRLSFFLDCGLDLEYLALARACRKLWAIAMRDVFGADPAAQRFKLHVQTSGRSLIAREFHNNLTRTATELLLAYMNQANSCHSNSADEPFTTPSQAYVRLAAHGQAILLEESGLFAFMMNGLSGSPGMTIVQQAVEAGILEEWRRIDGLGGVLAAVEQRYQRSQIQLAAHRYERQIAEGVRPMIGLNRYAGAEPPPAVHLVRTPRRRKELQVRRLRAFKRRNAGRAARALDDLARVVERGGNTFAELLRTVECCSLGQITARLHEVVGYFRPMV